jgi:2-polyprenyl-6-methoxyphenol hydroxylase-like FAD-dependent oxidoreductase
MSRVVICGGGACGLLMAMLLDDDGHQVVVLERDAATQPAPTEAWEVWERRGVSQFRLPHFLLPKFAELLSDALPDVLVDLKAAGALEYALGPVQGVTARRPFLEAVLAGALARRPGVEVRRGAAVDRLVARRPSAGSPGPPEVVGVVAGGDEVAADLVVDASGRRSPLPRWLEEVGARRPQEEEEDSGFVYYGRHLRSTDGAPVLAGPMYDQFGSVLLLGLPGDHGTAGVGIVTCSEDQELRRLFDEAAWYRALGALPGGAQMIGCEPISPMVRMSKIEDRYRRLVVDGEPVAHGVVALADSWACTNPTLGRGLSLGLWHATLLRDVIRTRGTEDRLGLVAAFDAVTEAQLTPWYRSTLWWDRHRLTEVRAAMGRAGGGDVGPIEDVRWDRWLRLTNNMNDHVELLMPFLEVIKLESRPEDVVERPEVVAFLDEIGAPLPSPAGPTREELLQLVA